MSGSAQNNGHSASRPPPRRPLRGAVIGAGHFGRFHAQKLAAHPDVDFLGVVDLAEEQGRALSAEFGVPWVRDRRDLPARPDFVTIATPAHTHATLALACLEDGVHVFLEKPVATDTAAALRLIARADAAGLVLQVDHQERFFLAERGLFEQKPVDVSGIRVRRLGPPPPRPSDCSAVLDLTIHDLDWLHALLGSPAELRSATGARGDTGFVESLSAAFRFPGDLDVVIETSRIHPDRCRDARIEIKEGVVDIDFVAREIRGPVPGGFPAPTPGRLRDLYGEHPFQPMDFVGKSIAHFLHCIRLKHTPIVDGNAGLMALESVLKLETFLDKAL